MFKKMLFICSLIKAQFLFSMNLKTPQECEQQKQLIEQIARKAVSKSTPILLRGIGKYYKSLIGIFYCDDNILSYDSSDESDEEDYN